MAAAPELEGQWRWVAVTMFTVGYGANQFVPLLVEYRHTLSLSDPQATAVFGVYALGLVPGLLLGGRASDRYGRRRLTIGFAATSLLATTVLVGGRWGVGWLYGGRLLTGVVSGVVFTVGTAWLKELSAGSAPGTGARRAGVAMTAGFGVGPLVAGLLGRWAPAPLLSPYLVHLGLTVVALLLVRRVVETRERQPADAAVPIVPVSVADPRFRQVVAPLAPWVFGSVTIAFTTLPAHAVGRLHGLGVAFPGLLAAAALGAGYLVQPLGRRAHAGAVGPRGDARAAAAVSLGVVAASFLVAAYATARPGMLAAGLASLVLGAGYGLSLTVGLREVEALAAPEELGATVSVFYSLAYAGLAVPVGLSFLARGLGYAWSLVVPSALTAATALVIIARKPRRRLLVLGPSGSRRPPA